MCHQQAVRFATHVQDALTRYASSDADVAMMPDKQTIDKQWKKLHLYYSQPHRHYHTLKHLDAMFAYFEQYRHKLHDPCAVALAIWYHDIIYDIVGYDTASYEATGADTKVKSNKTLSNEKQSADYFAHTFIGIFEDALIKRVVQLIHCTETHTLPDTSSKQNSSSNPASASQNTLADIAYFLDMDLAVLGADWKAYQQYSNAVRLEYAHVPLSVYRTGRRQILQNFLQRERLYFSDDFFERFENQARDNILQEIKLLTD